MAGFCYKLWYFLIKSIIAYVYVFPASITHITFVSYSHMSHIINTSFIVAEVFVEELAAITAATAPRGNGELGVAAAMIG